MEETLYIGNVCPLNRKGPGNCRNAPGCEAGRRPPESQCVCYLVPLMMQGHDFVLLWRLKLQIVLHKLEHI